MGSKKRKESSGAADEPTKKNKKSNSTGKKRFPEPEVNKDNAVVAEPGQTLNVPSGSKHEPAIPDNAAAVKSKKSRKRAADFMSDDEELADSDGGVKIESTGPAKEPAKKKAKKSKKGKKSKDGESLAADGANGVIEHSREEELETVTTHKPVATSMQAEAERTVDRELEDGFGGFASEDVDEGAEEVEAEDNAAALLAGFDSDTEDKQEDEGLDLSKIPGLPKSKKIQKKLEKAKAKGNVEGPGAVYVGRIPHGFYEKEMKAYFSQFGDISQLRLSRNKRTGASKHFAFIEFASDSVARIAAEAMDNYLMFGHILKCKYAEPGSLHPDVWKGANRKFRKIPHDKLEREHLAAPKTEKQWQKKVDKEQRKRDKKAEKMKSIGLEMPLSSLTSPSAALQLKLADRNEPKQIEEEEEEAAPAGAIEPPEDVPKDEVAVKASKKSKKDKKSKKGNKDELGAVPDSKPVTEPELKAAENEPQPRNSKGKAAASTTEVVKDDVETGADKKEMSKAERKAMKKARKSAGKSINASELAEVEDAAQETPEDPAADTQPDAKAELSADFISLGQFDDDEDKLKQSPGGGKKLKPWKVKKPKKERKNLVKARGPKSKLVSTKPKPDPNATGKIPGLPLMGKGKYDKATRLAHKELKKKILAERGARGWADMEEAVVLRVLKDRNLENRNLQWGRLIQSHKSNRSLVLRRNQKSSRKVERILQETVRSLKSNRRSGSPFPKRSKIEGPGRDDQRHHFKSRKALRLSSMLEQGFWQCKLMVCRQCLNSVSVQTSTRVSMLDRACDK